MGGTSELGCFPDPITSPLASPFVTMDVTEEIQIDRMRGGLRLVDGMKPQMKTKNHAEGEVLVAATGAPPTWSIWYARTLLR